MGYYVEHHFNLMINVIENDMLYYTFGNVCVAIDPVNSTNYPNIWVQLYAPD